MIFVKKKLLQIWTVISKKDFAQHLQYPTTVIDGFVKNWYFNICTQKYLLHTCQ